MIKPSLGPLFVCLSLGLFGAALARADANDEFKVNKLVDAMPTATFGTLQQASMLIESKVRLGDNATRPMSKPEIVAKALYSYCDITKFSKHNSAQVQRSNFDELLNRNILVPCESIVKLPVIRPAPRTSRIAVLMRLRGLCDWLRTRADRSTLRMYFMDLVENT